MDIKNMNNLNIVIIGQNEGESIQNMLSSLILDLPKARRIWILDRCTDDSESQLKAAGEFYLTTPPKLKGRQTSYCRNLGFLACDEGSDVLFLDGDRYPSCGTLSNLKYWNKDIALLLLDNDDRVKFDFKNAYGSVHNGFYSCGVFIKRQALIKIFTFQKGKIFNTDIQNDWGIEDTYLGDVCYHLGLTCDLYLNVRLNGMFKRNLLDSLNVLEKRFKLRQKLNVKW